MNQSLTLLATGKYSEIYLLADGRVVKLLRAGMPPEIAYAEVTKIQAAQAVGVATPIVREVVEYQGRFGIVLERLEGPTMLATLLTYRERAEELGRQLADLHADLHTRVAFGLPALHDTLRHKVTYAKDLPEPVRADALAALGELPEGNRLCHGDLHPGNIILTPAGPVIVDWLDVTAGCPAADVARTVLLLRYGASTWFEQATQRPDVAQVVRQLQRGELGNDTDPRLVQSLEGVRLRLHDGYCRRYAELRPADAAQVAEWLLPVGAAWKYSVVVASQGYPNS